MERGRIRSLDSVRGLAALAVVFSHVYRVLEGPFPFIKVLAGTPLAVMVEGQSAVIVFFVLSGFVLSLSFFGAAPPTWREFLVRRVARIYPAYWVALAGSAVCIVVLWHADSPNRFRGFWSAGFSLPILVAHIPLVGVFDSSTYDAVIWTLVHEMRISLVFPLIALAFVRGQGRRLLVWYTAGAACISLVPVGIPFVDTAFYATFFVWGAMLAQQRARAAEVVQRLAPAGRWGLLGAAVLALSFTDWFMPEAGAVHILAVDYFLAGAGALALIALTLGWRPMSALLTAAPLSMLGRISYSLYLLHPVVLGAIIYAVPTSVMSPPVEVLVSIPLALVAAYASYRFVERPGIAAGGWVLSRLRTRVLEPLPRVAVAYSSSSPGQSAVP